MASLRYTEYDGNPEGYLDADENTLCSDLSSSTFYLKTSSLGSKCGWTPFAVNTFKLMATGDIRMMVEDATGKLLEKIIPKGTSQMLGTDANGNLILSTPTVPLLSKAGTIALASTDVNAGTKAVVFASPYPANTTYNVIIHYNGAAMVYSIASSPAPTNTGFTFSYLATLNGTAYWTTTPITG